MPANLYSFYLFGAKIADEMEKLTDMQHVYKGFVRMLQGLVEGLVDVSMSMTKLSSRLDFFFIVYLSGMSLIQMTVFGLSSSC